MSNVAVVYWSGTGNTEAMAKAVAQGVEDAGSKATIIFSDDFNKDMVSDYDSIAFGCPAMGDEVLEEDSFEPMFEQVEDSLSGKKVALFGSYEWNDGQWMKDWEERTQKTGAEMTHDPVVAYGHPDDECTDNLKKLGASLA